MSLYEFYTYPVHISITIFLFFLARRHRWLPPSTAAQQQLFLLYKSFVQLCLVFYYIELKHIILCRRRLPSPFAVVGRRHRRRLARYLESSLLGLANYFRLVF